jgi:phage-related protein
MQGFGGAGALEIVEDHRGDTFRAVYTVRVLESVYVLHAFQKKLSHGIKTAKHDVELIRSRLAIARKLHEQRTGGKGSES